MTRADRDVDLWALPPSDDELVFSLEEPLESDYHRDLMFLLIEVLKRKLGKDAYVGGNQAVYFSELQVKNRDFLVPDVFCIAGGADDTPRLGWVVWKEGGRMPDLVVEFTSPSTASEDRGKKRDIYELIRVREYFIFDPATGELEGWHNTGRFEPIRPDTSGRLPSQVVGGSLGVASGHFLGNERLWVRVWDGDGQLVPHRGDLAEVAERRAEEESRRAEEESRRAEEESRRAEDLAQRLAAYEAKFGALPTGEAPEE